MIFVIFKELPIDFYENLYHLWSGICGILQGFERLSPFY